MQGRVSFEIRGRYLGLPLNQDLHDLHVPLTDGSEKGGVSVDGLELEVWIGSEQSLDGVVVILVDGPVQARLVVLPANVNVSVLFEKSFHDNFVASLASMNQMSVSGTILKWKNGLIEENPRKWK